MNQSEFLAVTCNLLKAREKSRVEGAIAFASHWLKKWREIFEPITKRSNRNRGITFDSHLKIALQLIKALMNTVRLRSRGLGPFVNANNKGLTLKTSTLFIIFW